MYYKPSRSKVKVTARKRHLIAKLMLSFRKSGSLNLMAKPEFDRKLGNSSLEIAVGAHAQYYYKFGQKAAGNN